MNNLYTHKISSSPDTTSLDLISDKSISLTLLEAEDDNSTETMVSRMVVKQNMELMANMVKVTDTQGDQILRINRNGVR